MNIHYNNAERLGRVTELPMQINVNDFIQMREEAVVHTVLDVREDWELEICSVDNSLDIPMNEIAERSDEIPNDRPVIVMCHHGIRSWQITVWLREHGFENVSNLSGGIDILARTLDEDIPVY